MKLMKRILALVLGASLLSPITSFAAQSEEALALYRQVEADMSAMNDIHAYYDLKMQMSGTLLEQSGVTEALDMRIEMDTRMSGIQDPQTMRYKMYSRMSTPDGTQATSSAYYADGWYYIEAEGAKFKYPMDLGTMTAQVQASAGAFGASEDMFRDLNLWDEGENKVVGYTIDDSKFQEYMNMVLGSVGLGSVTEGFGITIRGISGEYVVNPQGQCIKMRMKMTMDMTMEGKTVTAVVDGDIGIADPGQPVEVPLPDPAAYTDITASVPQQ